MSALAERLRNKYFGSQVHPYRTLEAEVDRLLRPEETLLDAGCGRGAPVLRKYVGRARSLIGVDVVDFRDPVPGVRMIQGDLGRMDVQTGSVDIVMSRSVMEHVADPAAVYSEIYRVLRPGGRFVFLTPNLWDYASLIAKCVPNRLHPWIVARTEGRAEEDVFPVCYRTNTRGAVYRWAQRTGFQVQSFGYLGQYPGYFLFNGALFLLATAYEKTISRFDALGFLRGWIFAVLRKPDTARAEGAASSEHVDALRAEASAAASARDRREVR
jgi:SAM-dependent methyltransferase